MHWERPRCSSGCTGARSGSTWERRCGRQYLDISEFRLSATRDELRALAYSGNPSAVFDRVWSEMRQAGFLLNANPVYEGKWGPQTVNYLAWLDGPHPPRSCGQATSLLDRRRAFWNRNNLGGKLALVYRRSRGFCGEDTVRHEIGHNLGALQPDAPHTRDGVHCTDAAEDTMCEGAAPVVARGARHAVLRLRERRLLGPAERPPAQVVDREPELVPLP